MIKFNLIFAINHDGSATGILYNGPANFNHVRQCSALYILGGPGVFGAFKDATGQS